MSPDREAIRALVADTLTVLLKNSLPFKVELQIQGLIGVTVDKLDVFIIHLDERFGDSALDLDDNPGHSPTVSHHKEHAKSLHSRFRMPVAGNGWGKKFTRHSTANRILSKYSGNGAQRRWQQVGSNRSVMSSISSSEKRSPDGVHHTILESPGQISTMLGSSNLKDEPPPDIDGKGREIVQWEELSSTALKDNAIYLSDEEDEAIVVKKERTSLGFAVNNNASIHLQGIVQQALNKARLVNQSTAYCNQEQTYFNDISADANSSQQTSVPQGLNAQWNYQQKQFQRNDNVRENTMYDSTTRYTRNSSSQQYAGHRRQRSFEISSVKLEANDDSVIINNDVIDQNIYLGDEQAGNSFDWHPRLVTSFQCNICVATFRHQPSLYRHQIKAHGRTKNKIGRPNTF